MTICHNYDIMTDSDSSTTLATDYSPATLGHKLIDLVPQLQMKALPHQPQMIALPSYPHTIDSSTNLATDDSSATLATLDSFTTLATADSSTYEP